MKFGHFRPMPPDSLARDDRRGRTSAAADRPFIAEKERTRIDGAGNKVVVVDRSAEVTFIDGIDEASLPVFQQKWWLDVARQADNFGEATVFKSGVLVGSLPYIMRRGRVGLRYCASPDWSHLGGPVVSQTLSDAEKSAILRQLIAQLPRSISFGFRCPPASQDRELIGEAFKAAGFRHFTETTFSQSPDQANVMERLTRKHRLHIKSAAKALDIAEISEDQFIDFYSVNLAESGIKSHERLDLARELIARGRGSVPPRVRVIAAGKKAAGVPLDAAIACAWDSMRYYYWMSSRRRRGDNSPHDPPHPDAIKLLIVTAMAHARDLGLIFDADGCSTPGHMTLYRDVLGIPNEEFRDVYERLTRLAVWYRDHNHTLKKIASVLRLRGQR